MKLKALTDLSLRKSPDPTSEDYEEWHNWKAGTTFDPPPHMDVQKALDRGIAEKAGKVSDGEK